MSAYEPEQAPPSRHERRVYFWVLFSGILTILLLWLGTLYGLFRASLQHVSHLIIIAILCWPFPIMGVLALSAGLFLLAGPPSRWRFSYYGRPSPEREDIRYIWIGITMFLMYITLCLGTLFSPPFTVITIAIIAPFGILVAPTLTLAYMRRIHRRE
jgi:hypothetical protein